MARGRIPKQVPIVPQDTFIAFDFLYQWAAESERVTDLLLGLTRKSNDAKINDDVLAEDQSFLIYLRPFQKIRFRMELVATGNCKFRTYGPTGPELVSIAYDLWDGHGGTSQEYKDAYSISDIVTTHQTHLHFIGVIHNGATAGNFGLRWAQNSASATPSIIYAGSNFQYSSVDD